MSDFRLTRRGFLKGLGATGLAGVAAASAYASFDGFRLAQLTDLHHSRFVPIEEIRRVVRLTNEAQPDLVALTGDYATLRQSYIEPCAAALGALAAPAGVWAVLGNHDHYNDAELTALALARQGIRVLNNTSALIERGGATLQLAGIDDWGWGKTDWARALDGIDRTRPSLLLSHEPRVFDMAETDGISLILSGHTHGGQLSLPFAGPPARFIEEFRYIAGRYERAGRQLYVARGTGMVGLPIRFGARPEIALLRLRRRAPESAA